MGKDSKNATATQTAAPTDANAGKKSEFAQVNVISLWPVATKTNRMFDCGHCLIFSDFICLLKVKNDLVSKVRI